MGSTVNHVAAKYTFLKFEELSSELPPFDTKKFVFTDGYVNDIIASVENGSVIRLEPRDDWQFGPPGNNAIDLGVSDKSVTIVGNGSTILVTEQSVLIGSQRLYLENLTIKTVGDTLSRGRRDVQQLRPYLNNLLLRGHITVLTDFGATISCKNVNFVCAEPIDPGQYLVYLLSTTSERETQKMGGILVESGSFMRMYHDAPANIAASNYMLYVDGGVLSVRGTLYLGHPRDAATSAASFVYGRACKIDALHGKIQINGAMAIYGETYPVVESLVGDLIINTQNLDIPAVVIYMIPSLTSPVSSATVNVSLCIRHLTLVRDPEADPNPKAAFMALTGIEDHPTFTFDEFTDAPAVHMGDIVGDGGVYDLDSNNRIFVGQNSQVGFHYDLAEVDQLYLALTPSATEGIADITVQKVTI